MRQRDSSTQDPLQYAYNDGFDDGYEEGVKEVYKKYKESAIEMIDFIKQLLKGETP